MPILSKGYTFTGTDTVTSTKLNNLVDSATLASGCVDDTTTQLSGGQIIVKNGGITPSKLSTGAPTWTTGNNLTVNGTITSGGTIYTSNGITTSGNGEINGSLTVVGGCDFQNNCTITGQLIAPGTATGRTVPMVTAAASPNAISFGWSAPDLLVKIDETQWKVTLTSV